MIRRIAFLLLVAPSLAWGQSSSPAPDCSLSNCAIAGNLTVSAGQSALQFETGWIAHVALGLPSSFSLYVAAAATRDGSNTTWIGQQVPGLNYFDTLSTLESISQIGYLGIVGASRTSDGVAGHTAAIGVAGLGFNNTASDARGTWAFYGLGYRNATALGGAFGMEIESANAGPAVAASPYSMGVTGTTAGLWVGVGGEPGQNGVTLNPSSCAVCVITSALAAGGVWAKGLQFQATALSGTDGVTGTATAIEMAKGHEIRWVYDGSDAAGFGLRSDATAAGGKIIGVNGAITFADSANETVAFKVNTPAARKNSITVNAGSSTVDPQFNVTTADGETNVGAGIVTIGLGNLYLGTGMGSNTARHAEVGVGQDLADLGDLGLFVHCNSKFLANGDACEGTVTLTGIGSTTASIPMTADGAAAGATNILNVSTDTKITLGPVTVTCQDITTTGTDYSWMEPHGALVRNAGNAAYAHGTPDTPLTNGTVTGAAVVEAADTTNQGLALSFTPPTGNTDTWHCLASVRWARAK